MKSPCWVSVQIYGLSRLLKEGRCPDLRWDPEQGRYFCRQAEESEEVKEILGAGITGCCSSLNTWRQDVRDRSDVRYPSYPVASSEGEV